MVSSNSVEGEWVLDSGCSFHMSPHKEWFIDFRREHGTVLFVDNKTCQIFGSRSILLQMADGCSKTLSNVRYVPDLKRNLISIEALDACDFAVKIDKGAITVIRGAMIIMKGSMKNGLYVLDGMTATCNATVRQPTS